MHLQECKTAEELLEHYKAVKARVKQWKPPARSIEIVEQIEPASAVPVKQAAPIPVPELSTIYAIPPEPPPARYPTISAIIEAVCLRFKIARVDLLSQRRTQNIVTPRQIAMTLARTMTLHGLPTIGKHFGDRDHTTVLSGLRKIERLRASNAQIDLAIRELEAEIAGSLHD